MRSAIPFVVGFFALSFCFGSGLLVGLIAGEGNCHSRRFLEEQEVVAPVVAADSAYQDVKIEFRSNGGVILMGAVATADDKARLRNQLIRAVGEKRAGEIVSGVEARR